MKRNIKSIQGRQVAPNPNLIGPECIRVTKVYDWVVLTNRDRNKVPIPEECFAQIENCRHQGNTVTATCSEVEGSRSCDFVGSRPAPEDVGPGAQIVTLAFHVHIRVQFFCNGAPLPGCNFVVPVSFVDDVILCFPEGTEINCNIFDVQCSVLLNQMLGNMVVLDVVMCKDVQVEAEVKLEVEAKFCGPRQIVPIPEEEINCPIPTFPQQCPTFFPPLNCECQAAAEFDDTATIFVIPGVAPSPTAVTGNLLLDALVCDQCTLANSRIEMEFTDFPQPSPAGEAEVDQSFTFFATQFNQPLCADDTLTVTGFGRFTLAGQDETDVQFEFTFNDTTNTVTFFILNQGGFEVLANGTLILPEDQIDVGPCERFGS